MMYQTTEYRRAKDDLTFWWATTLRIDYPVDLVVKTMLWKQRDTDNAIKIVLDALQCAGVVTDDKLIRDIVIRREYHKRDEIDQLELWLVSTDTDVAMCDMGPGLEGET